MHLAEGPLTNLVQNLDIRLTIEVLFIMLKIPKLLIYGHETCANDLFIVSTAFKKGFLKMENETQECVVTCGMLGCK